MFDNYPDGYDLTLLNADYIYPYKKENGQWTKGCMVLTAIDNVKHELIKDEIDDPDYTYYLIKDDVIQSKHIDYNVRSISKEDCIPVTVKYKDLLKDIADKIGETDFFFDNIRNNNRGANKLLHVINPKVVFSDMNIEDYYRFLFSKKFQNRSDIPITKGFLDIEADTIHMKGDFPELGECPVNAITYIDAASNRAFTLLLRNENNPQITEFEQALKNKTVTKEFRQLMFDHIGGKKGIDKFPFLATMKFNFMMFDEEIDLIAAVFNIIHQLRPNFVMAWNMAFDIPYLIQRIINLGFNPESIMCYPEFKNKIARYFVDKTTEIPTKRKDSAEIIGYTVYLDQLLQFAGVRVGGKKRSMRLDDVTMDTCGFGKLDYHTITPYIAELPYKNYKVFVFYNIMDVIDQVCIEHKVNDIQFVFMKAILSNTRYYKIHRQTVYLINKMISLYWDKGLLCGNNKNKFMQRGTGDDDFEDKYAGAFVADPIYVNDYSRFKINGHALGIFDNLDDYDYKRLYPTMMQQFNISDETQIGRLIFPENTKFHEVENLAKSEKFYCPEGGFIDDLATRQYIEFCRRWLGLAGFAEMIDDMYEFFQTQQDLCGSVPFIHENGTISMYYRHKQGRLKSMYRRVGTDHPSDKYSLLDAEQKGRLKDVFIQNLGFDPETN